MWDETNPKYYLAIDKMYRIVFYSHVLLVLVDR
jgi:hypothetical protein